MKISIVVAKSENNVIGLNNQLPWHLPEDLKHFKRVTLGHHVIMGRKTYESMGKPLSGRTNVIITRDANYKAADCLVAHSLKDAIQYARYNNEEEAFLIGGAEIIRQSMDLVDKIYLTEIHAEIKGDVFLPEINKKQWKETERREYKKDEKHNYDFSIVELERIPLF